MIRNVLLLVLSVFAVACDGPASPPAKPAAERVSAKQYRLPKDVKVDAIVDAAGAQRGFSTIARDNSGPTYIVCACQSGCAESMGNRCKTIVDDSHTGYSTVTCEGACYNSENRSCGGCVFAESPTPPSPAELNPVGVDVTGGNQPGVDPTPEKAN